MTARASRVLIPLAAFLAVLPMLVAGPSCGHDFDFHVLSWLEAASQFAHLHWPHWAYTPAYNAGEPRFLFYPPLSWALGGLLGLILPWTLVPAAFTFMALTLAGFTGRRLVSRYAGEHTATLAAVFYLANPYMLFTAYERTAYGELLAAAWVPLLLEAALQTEASLSTVALPVALLWLSNAPAGVMGCYALALLTLVRLALPSGSGGERLPFAARVAGGTLLGLLLSAFYLLPAAFEQRFIQPDMAIIEGMRIADNTLFHHMPPSPDNAAHDAVLHTASCIAVALLALTAALALASLRARSGGRRKSLPLPLFVLLGTIALLLTPRSLAIWAHTPELRYLQFPWRLLALVTPITALAGALALDRVPMGQRWSVAGAAFAVPLTAGLLVVPSWQGFRQECDTEDTVAARTALFHSAAGSEPTDEYTPRNADNDALGKADPPFWLVPDEGPDARLEALEAPPPTGTLPGQAPTHLDLQLAVKTYLILNRRAYPDWQVLLNGRPVPESGETREARQDGLLALLLPAGHEVIDLRYRMRLDQIAGVTLSLFALPFFFAPFVRRAGSLRASASRES